MLIVEAAYKGAVVAYAFHRSPTYPWARFSRNVGDPELFIGIDRTILWVGAVLALTALCVPNRKRWAAAGALAAHLFLLGALGVFSVNRSHY
jgi:hypothetical protein